MKKYIIWIAVYLTLLSNGYIKTVLANRLKVHTLLTSIFKM